jgi:ribonuclease HI
MQKEITIFTDGACSGNPGKGGWAAVLLYKKNRKEISGGYQHTTNNRMELTAVIEALKAIKSKELCKIDIFTDSQLIYNAFEKGWIYGWVKKNWKRNKKDPVLNPDLWQQILELMKKHDVKFHWLEGHAGHTENERCDVLAREAASGNNLSQDEGYILKDT